MLCSFSPQPLLRGGDTRQTACPSLSFGGQKRLGSATGATRHQENCDEVRGHRTVEGRLPLPAPPQPAAHHHQSNAPDEEDVADEGGDAEGDTVELEVEASAGDTTGGLGEPAAEHAAEHVHAAISSRAATAVPAAGPEHAACSRAATSAAGGLAGDGEGTTHVRNCRLTKLSRSNTGV